MGITEERKADERNRGALFETEPSHIPIPVNINMLIIRGSEIEPLAQSTHISAPMNNTISGARVVTKRGKIVAPTRSF